MMSDDGNENVCDNYLFERFAVILIQKWKFDGIPIEFEYCLYYFCRLPEALSRIHSLLGTPYYFGEQFMGETPSFVFLNNV